MVELAPVPCDGASQSVLEVDLGLVAQEVARFVDGWYAELDVWEVPRDVFELTLRAGQSDDLSREVIDGDG